MADISFFRVHVHGKKAMHTTKEKLLFLAKFRCQIIGRILMNSTDQRRKRFILCNYWSCWKSMVNSWNNHICFSWTYVQVKMSTEMERRVENLLAQSIDTSSTTGPSSGSSHTSKQSLPNVVTTNSKSTTQVDAGKEKISLDLRDMQNFKKVHFKFPIVWRKSPNSNPLKLSWIADYVNIFSHSVHPRCKSNAVFQGKPTSI